MRFLLSLIHCCLLFSCQKDFSGLENAPSLPTYLNGEWELVAQEKDGILERVKPDHCGSRRKIMLSIESTKEVEPAIHYSFDRMQYIGKGDYQACNVDPNTYEIKLTTHSCPTFFYLNPENPTQWVTQGIEAHYTASWRKNQLKLLVKEHYAYEENTKLIYRKL